MDDPQSGQVPMNISPPLTFSNSYCDCDPAGLVLTLAGTGAGAPSVVD